MPTWPERTARVAVIVDRTFGEAVTLKARLAAGVNSRSAVDGTRPDQTVVGVFSAEQRMEQPPSRKLQEKGAREVAANMVQFDCDEAALIWVPRTNDHVVRASSGLLYTVTAASRDDSGRIILVLSAGT